MIFIRLFLCLSILLVCIDTNAKNDSIKINKNRLLITSSLLGSSLVASYYYVENSWWSEKKTSFHFDDGADLKYALNVDKAGHFIGGLYAADIFKRSLEWSGFNEKRSLWYGGVFGATLQLAIEIKDGYAPFWGFSKWDLSIGSLGAFWPVAQHYNNDLQAINFKFSYFKKTNIYSDLEKQRGKETSKYAWQDDYPNQTYWISIDLNHFYESCCWPEWLNIAFGFSIDDTQYLNEKNQKNGGNNEWYIALDYNINKILKKWNTPLAKEIKHWVNYFHFPAPTIRILPKVEFHPLFL